MEKQKTNLELKVAENRVKISKLGATLGTQFFQAETRECMTGFNNRKEEIIREGNTELFLNRSPVRCRLTDHDIVDVAVREVADINGGKTISLLINQKENGTAEVTIPVSVNTETIFATTRDAVLEALKGDKSKVFSHPVEVCEILNQINTMEEQRIDTLIEMLKKMKQSVHSAIDENILKVKKYREQMTGSIDIVNPSANMASKESITINIPVSDK